MIQENDGYIGDTVCDGEVEVLHARVINSGPFTTARAEATKVVGVKGEF